MKLYNSLTQAKEDFESLKPGKTTIYVCGITPYDTTHLGHAFTYISYDALIKYLKYKGFDVDYTQNVTDINDRDNDILKRAKEQNVPWEYLSDYWTKRFLDDMNKLNWTHPTQYLKASENISSMLDLIKKLLENGVAYEINGSVYLDISKKPDFGKLSKLTKEQMLAKAKEFEEDVENPDKKNPLDVTLWRALSQDQPKHIPSFDPDLIGVDSPFGKGRPGWHIECSAMSISTLGEQIDIHGGGIDLIYPHHESEIAQSEEATKKEPFVKYWMHTGAVYYQGAKMSKSLGNLVMVSKLLEKYCANAIRWLLLSHHYRKAWEFKEGEMDEAEKTIQKLPGILVPPVADQNDINGTIKKFEQAMEDDLNTPKALEIILETTEEINNGNHKLIPSLQTMLNALGFKY